jgi:hypothetical protein
MNKKLLIILFAVVPIVVADAICCFINRTRTGNVSAPKVPVEYTDSQYGFAFSLPDDWKGYSVVTSAWEGFVAGAKGDVPTEHGPLISIRNPKWTEKEPYQDIPIMVFTLKQWDSLQQDEFHIGAAPINPSELGRNATYVFALPARYNFAFPTGYEEVEKILEGSPLRAF